MTIICDVRACQSAGLYLLVYTKWWRGGGGGGGGSEVVYNITLLAPPRPPPLTLQLTTGSHRDNTDTVPRHQTGLD